MNNTFRRLAAFGIVAAMQGCLVGLALAQANPPAAPAGGQPQQYGSPGSAPSAVPAAGPGSATVTGTLYELYGRRLFENRYESVVE